MARQNMRPQPWVKHMDAQMSFAGGLNTVADVTTMANSELSDISNMDISPRGAVTRRTGIKNHRRSAIWGDIKGFTWGGLNV
jgi:hypothetical protein